MRTGYVIVEESETSFSGAKNCSNWKNCSTYLQSTFQKTFLSNLPEHDDWRVGSFSEKCYI
jgi:hypothetical protein